MRRRGPDVGAQALEGLAANIRQRALGPVEEGRHTQLLGDPHGEPVPRRQRVRQRRARQRHEGHHVDDADAWVDPLVVTQVEPGDGRAGHRPGTVLADQRQHRTVVVRVDVGVEQSLAGGLCELADQVFPPALTEVHDAFKEHSRIHSCRGDEPPVGIAPIRTIDQRKVV
jgi:hypothetical protein